MAKRKRGRALFEVMSQHRGASGRAEANAPGRGIPTPKWWFKSKNRGDVRTFAPGESTAGAVGSGSAASIDVEEPCEPRAVLYSSSSSSALPAAPAPAEEAHDDAAVALAEPSVDQDPTAPRPQPLSVSLDRAGQLISLRLTYTSALIGGFGLFILIGIAVLIGRGFGKGPQQATAEVSTAALRQGPASPGVLSVPRRDGNVVDNIEGTGGGGSRSAGGAAGGNNNNGGGSGGASTGTRNPQQLVEPRQPATFFTDDPQRHNGLNYAIIQSYPDKETAEKAAKFLTDAGIACTVEKNLPNWRLPWADGCVVVGTRGFAKVTNNPQLEAYRKQISDASLKFTNGRRGFAAFAPSMYLWRKSN